MKDRFPDAQDFVLRKADGAENEEEKASDNKKSAKLSSDFVLNINQFVLGRGDFKA